MGQNWHLAASEVLDSPISFQIIDTGRAACSLRATILILRKTDMNTGTVKFYNGRTDFIQPTDGGKDVFVHVSALERAGFPGLAEGQKLQFELERDTKGRESAANLQLI